MNIINAIFCLIELLHLIFYGKLIRAILHICNFAMVATMIIRQFNKQLLFILTLFLSNE